jgi:hypothetical protein
MRWVEHVAHIGDMRNVYNISRKSERKRSLDRSRRRWKDNITVDLGEIVVPVAGFCEHGKEPSDSTRGGEYCNQPTTCFSRNLLHAASYLVS